MTSTTEFVFGYGSLAALPGAAVTRTPFAHGFVADLRGAVRGWGVAMDNRADLPGYKYYTDPAGRRPEVFVAFLDVRFPGSRADERTVTGVCLPVGAGGLTALDARERNYDRIEVTDRVDRGRDDGGRIWIYVGSAAGRARFDRGRAAGSAVIDAGYLQAVRAAFRGLGEAEWRACAASLDPGGLPVAPLVRHELP